MEQRLGRISNRTAPVFTRIANLLIDGLFLLPNVPKQHTRFFFSGADDQLLQVGDFDNCCFLFMEGEESLLDSIFDVDNVEELEDVDMVDVEEGEVVVGTNHQVELGQSSSMNANTVAQDSQTKNRKRKNKKKNKKKKGGSGSDITDINRFVLDTCKRLKERKSYLIWTAVGCLGVAALSDLVKEVDAIQACGGQKTADGRRLKFGGGILWSILKARDPNAFKEIMKKGKEFEKQFKQPDFKKAPNQNNQTCSKAGDDAAEVEPVVQKDGTEERLPQKRPVHERIRVPVSYEDLVEIEEPKDETV